VKILSRASQGFQNSSSILQLGFEILVFQTYTRLIGGLFRIKNQMQSSFGLYDAPSLLKRWIVSMVPNGRRVLNG